MIIIKKIVSISLGSSTRDHTVEAKILGERFILGRVGTDGDLKKARELFSKLDGKVDAFGIGGIDLHIYSQDRKYRIRDAHKIISDVKKTPVVDGSGLKMTLEKEVIFNLKMNCGLDLENKNVLLVSAADRFGMAIAFEELKCNVHYGDLIFGLGIPFPIKSLATIDRTIKLLGPIVSNLPFKLLYPTGSKQQVNNNQKHKKYYEWADVIAGDFHFIKKYLPDNIEKKIIITNTVTSEDINMLEKRGLEFLVTTTPELGGRSFGTNVLEAAFITLLDKPLREIKQDDYIKLLDKIDFQPRIEVLNKREIC
jgi:hypothetical protein